MSHILTLLIGQSVPLPVPVDVLDALDSIEITHADDSAAGLQIKLRISRSGFADMVDYGLVQGMVSKPFSRIVVIVTIDFMPQVLFDGFVTHTELVPSNQPSMSHLVVTAEDATVLMDMEEKREEHPAQDEMAISMKILAQYADAGVVPMVIPPPMIDQPVPVDRTPVQQGTDLAFLRTMASRFGYVFYLVPGPAPCLVTAYWGPPKREGVPQKTLAINFGAATNVDSLQFSTNALAPTTWYSRVQDRSTDEVMPVESFAATRIPLSSSPAIMSNTKVRKRWIGGSGLTSSQVYSRVQELTNLSTDNVVTGTGELDCRRYGAVLHTHELVGVRGAGFTNDGFYYVKRVTHHVTRQSYRQSFTITRDGTGSTTTAVPA